MSEVKDITQYYQGLWKRDEEIFQLKTVVWQLQNKNTALKHDNWQKNEGLFKAADRIRQLDKDNNMEQMINKELLGKLDKIKEASRLIRLREEEVKSEKYLLEGKNSAFHNKWLNSQSIEKKYEEEIFFLKKEYNEKIKALHNNCNQEVKLLADKNENLESELSEQKKLTQSINHVISEQVNELRSCRNDMSKMEKEKFQLEKNLKVQQDENVKVMVDLSNLTTLDADNKKRIQDMDLEMNHKNINNQTKKNKMNLDSEKDDINKDGEKGNELEEKIRQAQKSYEKIKMEKKEMEKELERVNEAERLMRDRIAELEREREKQKNVKVNTEQNIGEKRKIRKKRSLSFCF